MEPQTRNLVVGDGSVAATTAAAVLAGVRDVACRYNLTFSNVGVATETLVISYVRASGASRQLRQATLDPDETLELTGFPVNKGDSVYAVTTTASSVDYLAAVAADQAPLFSQVYGADGLPKSFPWILEQMAVVFG